MTTSNSQLSSPEHKRVLRDVIIPNSGIEEAKPHDRPRAVVLAGQPGAGKGGLTNAARVEFAQDAVVLDPDELRDHHPNVDQFRDKSPYTWSGDTHEDSSRWNKEVRALAIEGKRNLIIDTTLGNGDSAVDLIKDLQAKGYDVEIRGVVAHRLESELGVDRRFGDQFDRKGFGRYVPDSVGLSGILCSGITC